MLFARGNGKPTLTAVRNIEHMLGVDDILKKNAKQFATEMATIKERWDHDDTEMCHIKMDELMCATLSRLGFYEGVKIFEDTKKWYA